jgi:serine/threonine protein kinase
MSVDRVRPGEEVTPGYRAIGLLRRGEDVDVYDTWSIERDCRCVVKVLRPDRHTDRGARRRLISEGRLLMGFTHPHLVRAYEVKEHPSPVVVLETLSGDTLGYLIGTHGPRLPVAELCAMGVQLCSAIGYLHRNRLLHLDLKPSNVICHLDQAKLIDLGIARPPGRGRAGVGTAAYMAPEQVRGAALGTPADVWGLGALLYETATRVLPFGDEGAGAAPARAESLRSHRRVPQRLGDAIDSCLDPKPSARPTVVTLARVLRDTMPR